MMSRRRTLVRIALFTVTLGLAAQGATGPAAGPSGAAAPATASAVTFPRTLYLFLQAGPALPAPEARLAAEVLAARLQREGGVVPLEAAGAPPVPGTDEERGTLAQEAGADCWLLVTLDRAEGGFAVGYRLHDLLEDRSVDQQRLSKPAGAFGLDLWPELLAGVRDLLPPRPQKVVVDEVVRTETDVQVVRKEVGGAVTFQALPGTRLTGLPGKPRVVDESGRLTAELPPAATYRIRASRPGFYPDVRRMYVGREPRTLEMKQAPLPRFALDGFADFNSNVGGAFVSYLVPGSLYAEARFAANLFSLSPPFTIRWDGWDYRNLCAGLDLGVYLLPADAFFRPALTVGGFTRAWFTPEYRPPDVPPVILHPVFPWGVRLGAHLEFSRHPRRRFFIETAWSFYPYTPTWPSYMEDMPYDDGIMVLKDKLPPSLTSALPFLSKVVIDPREFRLGWRFQL